MSTIAWPFLSGSMTAMGITILINKPVDAGAPECVMYYIIATLFFTGAYQLMRFAWIKGERRTL